MVRQRAAKAPGEQGSPLEVPDSKKLQRLYYAGLQLPSPEGGFLEPLRVRPEDDKSATVLLECNTSSLRYALPIPAASRTERKKVKDQQEAGEDATCPRHGPTQRLIRVGNDLVCMLCGVPYGKI